MKASEIARLVEGRFEGGVDPELTDIAPLDRAGPEHLSFLADAQVPAYLADAQAGAVLISESLTMRGSTKLPRIVVKDVHSALATLLERFHPEPEPSAGIHPTAVLGKGVVLGEDVSIGPFVVLGGPVQVGARTRIGAHTVVGNGCTLGEAVMLHPGVTLYSRVTDWRPQHHSQRRAHWLGWLRLPLRRRAHRKIPQVGGWCIGNDVEIGANTTIDRGSVGATEIGDGVKIDNLVHIGHNVRIGEHSLIVAQVGISGARSGSGITLAGRSGVNGHIRIGDDVVDWRHSRGFGATCRARRLQRHPGAAAQGNLRAQAQSAESRSCANGCALWRRPYSDATRAEE